MDIPVRAPPQTGNRLMRSQKVFQRAYMACLPCRKIKAKCEISDDPSTCTRCKREKRPCAFSARRSTRQNRQTLNARKRHASCGADDSLIQDNPVSGSDPTHTREHESSRSQANVPVQPNRHRPDANSPAVRSQSIALSAHANLREELMQTVVESSQDAMNLLFRAAADEHEGDDETDLDGSCAPQALTRSTPTSQLIHAVDPYPQEVLDYWNKSRFIREGWMSAREGVVYIDLFFANLSHLSLVTNTYFARHEHHGTLIFREPLLCSMLLMISSRHHSLAHSAAASRSHIVHDLLWRHIEQLIHRLAFGSCVYPESKSRTLGCVEALLLLTEWHPRAAHVPQSSECCDGVHVAPAVGVTEHQATPRDSSKVKWREEVLEPARRADRMSWMMLGVASSLAHELGIYDETSVADSVSAAKQRLRRLLYLNVNQLSLTLGCRSFLPFEVSDVALDSITSMDSAYLEGEKVISLWIDLTGILKLAKGMSSSSRTGSSRNVQFAVDQLQPLLGQWFQRFQDFKPHEVSTAAVGLLFIDYQYVKMFIASVGVQGLVESSDINSDDNNSSGNNLAISSFQRLENALDTRCVVQVLDASHAILTKTISLARSDVLRYCPARVFFRIVSACVFLLKVIGLGVPKADVDKSLCLLDECTEALASSSEENHLWGKFAVLIERYTGQCKSKTADVNNCPPVAAATPPVQFSGALDAIDSELGSTEFNGEAQGTNDVLHLFESLDGNMDNWLTEPWDLWMSPSDVHGNHIDISRTDPSHNLWCG